ncbi:MAG: hypothetical protein R3C30_10560 [Hyphomonadaceae bacterium]
MFMKVDLPAVRPEQAEERAARDCQIDGLKCMDGRALALGAIGFVEAARFDGELGRRLCCWHGLPGVARIAQARDAL